MLYLQTESIIIDCTTSLWHWDVKASKHEILKPKKFKKILKNKSVIYALILSNKNENIAALIIFYEVANYTDIFFKENAGKLLEYEKNDYVIELNE